MAAREPFNVTAERSVPSSSSIGLQRSPWHSPVPYLFGGLAAMLGLIAFALLILACSYWKLSGYLGNEEDGERDLESGEGGGKVGENEKEAVVFEEKILVIMAGDIKPTFLATPMSSRSSSFGDNSTKSCCCNEKKCEKLGENGGVVKQNDEEHSGSGRLESTPETIQSGVDGADVERPEQRAVLTSGDERQE